MSPAMLAAVGLLGGLGAVGRLLLDGALARRVRGGFPFGTLAVNLSGAFALGLLVGAAAGTGAYRLLGIGLLGGYTTFSTWALESHRLAQDGEGALAGANLAVGLALGLAAAWLGRRLGIAL
jgi:CrcB protein